MSVVDNLALSSAADRNSNYRPEPDALLFLHLLLCYKLIQTITICAFTEAWHGFEYEWRLSCDAEQSAGLFRNHFTVVTNSLGAWENELLKREGSRIKAKRCFILLVHSLKYLDPLENSQRRSKDFHFCTSWDNCKVGTSASSHHKSAGSHILQHIYLHRVPPLCDGIKGQTALHYVSTTVTCWVLPELHSRQNRHWIIKFHSFAGESSAGQIWIIDWDCTCTVHVHVQALDMELLQ